MKLARMALRVGGGKMKENDETGESNYDIF
jgi:hypothetical protein